MGWHEGFALPQPRTGRADAERACAVHERPRVRGDDREGQPQHPVDQRRRLCPLFCALCLVVGLGALLLYFHIFCFHYPRAGKEIEEALQPWRAKGLRVEFVWAGAVGAGPAAMATKNKIEITLPAGATA
jgi:hypothetical protein